MSSLYNYKNVHGLLRAWALSRPELGGRQLAIVGGGRDEKYAASLHSLAAELGISDDLVFTGGLPLEETAPFYQAADVFVYPSFNETFGLPILEAMACGCPVVTSDTSAMPETAGGAAVLSDPKDPGSIGRAIVEAVGPGRDRLRDAGLRRAASSRGARLQRPPSTCTARSTSVGGICGNEDTRHWRRRIHRVAYLRPAPRARARRDSARRADCSGTSKRASP